MKAPSKIQLHTLLMNRIEHFSPSAKNQLLGELLASIAFERLDSLTDVMERINRIDEWHRKWGV